MLFFLTFYLSNNPEKVSQVHKMYIYIYIYNDAENSALITEINYILYLLLLLLLLLLCFIKIEHYFKL